jgi:biotin transporter BioY
MLNPRLTSPFRRGSVYLATMRDTLPFFLAMFVLTAFVELFALRRRYGRWGFSGCIISVAAFSGIVWMMNWILMNWADKIPEEALPLDTADRMCIGLSVLLGLLAFMVVALIPAGITALIYRKLRSTDLKR